MIELQTPDRTLYPTYSPMRSWGLRNPPARYVPQPQPPGTARVVLSDDYYTGPGWSDFHYGQSASPHDVFDIPAGQHERWRQAQEAYEAMQEEIAALQDQR